MIQEASRHTPWTTSFLIFLLIISPSRSTLALLGVLSLDATWASATVGRPQGEVDVLLAVQANHEGGDVHHLLAHAAERTRGAVSAFSAERCLDRRQRLVSGFIDEEFLTPQTI